MASDVSALLKRIHAEEIRFIDLRFTDLRGRDHHMTIPSTELTERFFDNGKMFDGSSLQGWKSIHESDMILKPDVQTAVRDPFFESPTLVLRCDVIEPSTSLGYDRDPRSLAKRAEEYLRSTGIADTAYFGPEPEFFVFDSVRWDVSMKGSFVEIDSQEAAWNSGRHYEAGNMGHRPAIKGGYVPLPPMDSLHELRSEMCEVLTQMGLVVEAHHHEVATAGQCEIASKFNTLVKKADELQILKYVIQNVADGYGKTVTFMPKPIVGDNGSGMHVHQSLFKEGKNLFFGDQEGLSDTALFYIGGIIKHAKALNAFTNPSTNSYKRLVPGFEAPVLLAYSKRNRSAAVRIPYVDSKAATRIEYRTPDPLANPYLAFSAMMMAGLDGIVNRIHPGQAINKDLYELPKSELNKIPQVAASLNEALDALEIDMEFLLKGGVFDESMIRAYIDLKRQEATRVSMTVSPIEFELYYRGG